MESATASRRCRMRMMPSPEELEEMHSWQRKLQMERSRGRKGVMCLRPKDRTV